MHGHSRKKNVFIYGPYYPLHNDKYLKMVSSLQFIVYRELFLNYCQKKHLNLDIFHASLGSKSQKKKLLE